MEFNPSDHFDVIHVAAKASVTQGTSEDIADGSQIDISPYRYLCVLVQAGTLGTGGMNVKFYSNATAAAAGQTAVESGSLDMAFVDANDDRLMAQEIRTEGLAKYLNIEVEAPSGTGNVEASIIVLGMNPQHSTEADTAFGSVLTAALGIA